jgi:hypothetical protein
LKEYNDRIAYNKGLIKTEEDYLHGNEEGGNNYYSDIITANKNLSTSNLDKFRNVKSDSRWVKSGPFGYLGIRKFGGILTPKSTIEEIAKLYKDISKKYNS